MGQNRTGLLAAIVILGILIAIVGGAVMGGLVGYYVVRSNPVGVQAPQPSEKVSAVGQAQPTTSATAAAQQNVTITEDSAIIQAVKKVEPAVVTVVSTLSTTRPTQRVAPQASGSGVVVDARGYIITNNHVVDGARRIDIIFSDSSKLEAKLVGSDAISDIAVLQVSKVPAVAGFGDSDMLQLGQIAIAIGSPLGNYRGSVTVGVISGLKRKVTGATQENLIQTDAAINHGNSGGPLVNAAGQIVGINTLVVRDTQSGDIAEGLGFAIPSNTVKMVFDQLVSKGKIEYPYLGIVYSDITAQAAAEQNLPVQAGALITGVTAGTPAAKAGVQEGDIVTAINGQILNEGTTLRTVLFQYKPGDTLTLSVVRGTQKLDIKVQTTVRPPDQGQP